jgi:hypothetical protein
MLDFAGAPSNKTARTGTKTFDISRISFANETHVKPSAAIRPASETEMPEQDTMTTTRRTELAPLLLDLLDFMGEKIQEAMADEVSQAGAVSEAAGAVPLLRDRLREDETRQAQFMLAFDKQMYDADAAKWWTDLARMERAEFEKEAAGLIGPQGLLAILCAVAAGPRTS